MNRMGDKAESMMDECHSVCPIIETCFCNCLWSTTPQRPAAGSECVVRYSL